MDCMCQICLNYLTLSNLAIRFKGAGQRDSYDSKDDDEESNGLSYDIANCDNETISLDAFVEECLENYAFLD